MNIKKLTSFLFELGMLKNIKHEGWRITGNKNPESVAEHSLRAAQIGFFLAKMENYSNPYKICTMLIFHDIGECRIGDIHKVANRYIDAQEENAVLDQLAPLSTEGEEIFHLWKKIEKKACNAGKIAKDADLLEQALTAREYIEIGYKASDDWLKNIAKHLSTKSAKKLFKTIKTANIHEWWKDLKKIT